MRRLSADLLALSLQSTVNYERNQKSQRSFKSVQINVNVFSSVLILL